mgnify:CR=1 FL=1
MVEGAKLTEFSLLGMNIPTERSTSGHQFSELIEDGGVTMFCL